MITVPLHAENPCSGSHLVPLAAALVATEGPVLEVGVGDWSTPFLARYCAAAGRELVSVEGSPDWAERMGARLVDYDEALPDLALLRWAVVLIDHWPETRRLADAALFELADRVLIHDAASVLRRAGNGGVAGHVVQHDTIVISPCR